MEEIAKESGLPITGGILTIVAASLGLSVGYGVQLYGMFMEFSYVIVTWWLGIAGFAFGLTSGVLMIKKRSLVMTLIGMVILLIVGILPLLWSFVVVEFLRESLVNMFYFYGVPTIAFAALSIIFAIVSRKKFT
ncbi:MAG: hypothetical protein H3Z54_12660 [archaeon]|nr:hypothetical protein [archaeon]